MNHIPEIWSDVLLSDLSGSPGSKRIHYGTLQGYWKSKNPFLELLYNKYILHEETLHSSGVENWVSKYADATISLSDFRIKKYL